MANESLSVGGLASGLDTSAIITGLIQIENQRVVREEAKKSDYELKLSTFNELKTKLADLNTKATDMNKLTSLNVFKSSTSDDTVANITGGTNATPGNFDIRVDSLASSLKVASRSYTDAVAKASLSLSGSFSISTSAAALKADPTTTSVTVTLDGTETLKDVAAKINRATGAGATASVVKMGSDDYRLMLSAVDEGTEAFTLSPISGTSLYSGGNNLDLVNANTTGGTVNKQSLRSTFDLRLADGGPASATSTFAELFNGLGTGHGITAGDTITITGSTASGTAASATYTIGATTDTLEKLMNNATNSIKSAFGGTATVSMNSSGEFVLTDTSGGTASMVLNLSFNDTNVVVGETSTLSMGTSKSKTDFKSVISEGKKAFFMMNDIPFSSQTNRNDTIIDGTSFEFKKPSTTGTSVKLTLDYDKDGIKKKVQDFLDTYNQLVKYLDEKSKVEVKKKDDKNQAQGLTSGVRGSVIKGPFAGDSNILGLKAQLQGMFTNSITELSTSSLSKYASLASMGITSEAKTGFLTINETTFSAAIDQDFEGIKRVFVTNGYSDNPSHTFGTSSKDTQTGIYNVDPSGTPRIDTSKDSATTTWVNATISGDALTQIITSPSGDSNGLTVKAASTSGTGKMTFVRGVAGQVKNFYDKINDYVDGFMTTTGKNFQDRINAQDAQIAKLEKRVASVKTRLTSTFSNLELSISKLQAQSAAFGNQISSFKR